MNRIALFVTAAIGGALLSTVAPVPAESAPKGPQTLGYVVTAWDNATYETKFADECPEGLAQGNDEFWWRGLSKADRDKLTNKGIIQPVDRRFISVLRGPKGEDVCWNPTIVQDPPLRTVKGSISYGFDLDGNTDGAATPKSCKHETFVSPEGTPGIDNQLYRIMGCHYGWRRNGVMDTFDDEERRNSGRGVVLIEITGVDDRMNDDAVNVSFYRAIDPYPIDSAGKIIPFGSYRIDANQGTPRYGTVTRGKIENGVLVTESRDLSLPFYGNSAYAEIPLRDMRIRLDMTAENGTKAKGFVGGYYDFDKWWEYMLKIEFLVASGDWSCPAVYEAAKRMADGYPDPKTGECTSISSAFKLEAIPAFILRPTETKQTASR
jgi:hypothetical protein